MAGTSESFMFRVLVYLVKDEDFCNKYIERIPGDFFAHFPVLGRVFDSLKSYRDQYKKSPTYNQTLPELVITQPPVGWRKPSDEEQDELWAFFESAIEDELRDKEWIEDNLQGELRRLAVKAAIAEGVEALQSDDYDEDAIAIVRDKLEKATNFTISEDIGTSIRSSLDERFKRREDEQKDVIRIPTLIGSMDDHLRGGGVPLKSLCMVSARTGIGKSVALVHLAKVAAFSGFPALYISMELRREEVEDRLDASLTRTLVTELYDSSAFIKDKFDSWHNDADIMVVDDLSGSFGIGNIKWLLDRLKRERGFVPKILCLDYADLLRLNPKSKEPHYLQLEHAFIELRGIAGAYNLVLWTASQLNRAGDEHGFGENISHSDGKLATCDFAFSINLPQDSKKQAMNPLSTMAQLMPATKDVNIFIQKSRLGPQHLTFKITQELAAMQFTTDAPTL